MSVVEIYTKQWCGYCARAKALLDSKGISYREVDITRNTHLEREMIQRSQRRTVPQIFVDDRPIGGYDGLARLAATGDLDGLLGNGSKSATVEIQEVDIPGLVRPHFTAKRSDRLMKSIRDMRARRHLGDAVSEHSACLYRYAFWLCGNGTVAEDLVVAAYARLGRGDLSNTGQVRCRLTSELRREYDRRFTSPPQAPLDAKGLEIEPEKPAHVRAIGSLPRQYREPLALEKLGDRIEEISQLLGIPGATILRRLQIAREALWTTLDEEGSPALTRANDR